MRLCGRGGERGQIGRLIAGAVSGHGGALVVRGDAGIGKSALLAAAIMSRPDLDVLRARGAESEVELPYAALHQLCAPTLSRLDRLPGPQADAVGTALGERSAGAPSRLLVDLGILGLISDEAAARPVCLVIDDAHWIDHASLQTLAFVARRIDADAVAMIFAARGALPELTGIPEIVLGGLSTQEARALLASVVSGRLDAQVLERIMAETRGNPLALLELPHGLRSGELAGGFGVLKTGTGTLARRLEEGFLRRVRSLPPATQRLLLLAAAEPLGDRYLLWRAARLVGAGIGDAAPAEADGLFTVGNRVAFRHPLVRSAIYNAGTADERRQVHHAIAEATDADADRDRRAWHLAKAASGFDQSVADELERSARRAHERGGPAAASAFLEMASELTPDPGRRAALLLMSANEMYDAGEVARAAERIGSIDVSLLDDLRRVELDLLRARLAVSDGRTAPDAPAMLARTARRLESLNVPQARRTYLHAFSAWMIAGPGRVNADLAEIGRAAVAAPPPDGDPHPSDLLLDGLARQVTAGYAAGLPLLRRSLAGFLEQPTLEDCIDVLWLACQVARSVWDHDAQYRLSVLMASAARDAGIVVHLRSALSAFSDAAVLAGDFAAAESAVAEISPYFVRPRPLSTVFDEAVLAGWQGRELDSIRQAISAPGADSRGRGPTLTLYAAAVLCNGEGRYEQALRSAVRATAFAEETGVSLWALPELVEAAARSDEPGMARDALARLRATTQASGTDWALGIDALCCALVTDDQGADGLYREALDRFGRTRLRTHVARAHLLYGEWLRREKKRVLAREHLRVAGEMFQAMGAAAFAGRAQRELAATGERPRTRAATAHAELSAQEGQIAQLAVQGLSNAEIAARMFLSPRTVEYHMHKIFVQLGITKRSQLHRVMPGTAAAAPG